MYGVERIGGINLKDGVLHNASYIKTPVGNKVASYSTVKLSVKRHKQEAPACLCPGCIVLGHIDTVVFCGAE